MPIWEYYSMSGILALTIKSRGIALRTFTLVIFFMATLLLSACGHNDARSKGKVIEKTYEVEEKSVVTSLYFTGVIEPLEIHNILSPLEGIVNRQYFKYGQQVNIGDKLYKLTIDKLEKEYIDSVSAYMKAFDDYLEKKRKFAGAEELWKLKFISDNDYHAEEIAKDEAFFALKQSVRNLKEALGKIGLEEDIDALDLRNPKVVEQIVSNKLDDFLVVSPYAGVALDPESLVTTKMKKDKSSVFGSEVKQGQVLLCVGNLNGLSIAIKVSEIDINQIKLGQKAIITGPGFPEFKLEGVVDFIDSQGTSESSAVPTFPVRIVIENLTPKQRDIIRIGMSAKVEIQLEKSAQIQIPIMAVFQENGIDKVNVREKSSGETNSVSIIVGKTTIDKITIEKGLKSGDIIVYEDS